jgi:hypothetical protein
MKKTGLLLSLILGVFILTGCNRPLLPIKGNSSGLSQEQIKTKIGDFINNNMMQPGSQVEITNVVESNGLYKLTIKIAEGRTLETYATRDGKIFFPDAVNIDEVEKQIQEAKNKQSAAPEQAVEIPKNNRPAVDLYVMSFCPFGNKAEDTLKPVYDLLKNKVAFNFHYIVNTEGDTVNSLHGQNEVVQNEREACVLKNYGKDKWFGIVDYVNKNCGTDGACFEAGAKTLGINMAGVDACVASQGVALMKTNEQASKSANANGSPTMTINGAASQAVYQYGNSEGYKQAICSAFTKAPAECSKVLASQTTTAQGGACAVPQ